MNPKVDAFLRGIDKWRQETVELRSILLQFPLEEEIKWGEPCYTFQGKNLVLIGAFKEYCALLFFKGALLPDPDGILAQPGTLQAGRQLRFTSLDHIRRMRPAILTCVQQAIEIERAGLKVQLKPHAAYTPPEELVAGFARMPELKTAFEALTPGRQRAYIFHFSQPKQPRTRLARIEKCLPHILAGKGLND
jgi:uncharacterized protein YdeI (YjbR/CyaY-like superfamily)